MGGVFFLNDPATTEIYTLSLHDALPISDETPTDHTTDPVAKAQRSPAAHTKASTRRTADGQVAHSFETLLNHLATLTRDDITFTDPPHVSIQKLAEPTPTQRQAFDLLDAPIPTRLT